MFIKTVAEKSSTILIASCTIALCIATVSYSKICAEGASKGIELCIKVLVPSLFPFMALCSFIVKSGLHQTLGKPLEKVMQHIFGLNGCVAPIILLSIIGGYPVGARGISSLYKSGAIDENQAKKAAMFSICAGPGFVINYVGNSLYGNEKIGYIILCSQIMSVIILGIAVNFISKIKENKNSKKLYQYQSKPSQVKTNQAKATQTKTNQINPNKSKPNPPLSTSIVESTAESSRGILSICIFVIIFSSFTNIISTIANDSTTKNAITCFLEVCTAVDSLSKEASIEMVAFATGFGGLCVHFQIFSVLEKIPINKLSFFTIRVVQGVITALLTHIGLSIFTETKAVFSTAIVETSGIYGGSLISGLALIVTAICFLFSLKSNKT